MACDVRPGIFVCSLCEGLYCNECTGTCDECGGFFCIPGCMLAHPHNELIAHANGGGSDSHLMCPAAPVATLTYHVHPYHVLIDHLMCCATQGSAHAALALSFLGANMHCPSYLECQRFTCFVIWIASLESAVDLPVFLFLLAYAFPLFEMHCLGR